MINVVNNSLIFFFDLRYEEIKQINPPSINTIINVIKINNGDKNFISGTDDKINAVKKTSKINLSLSSKIYIIC